MTNADVRPIRIAHLLGSLNIGGAERQVVNLLNSLAHLTPTLILTDSGQNDDLLRELDERVDVVHAGCRLSSLPAGISRVAETLRRRRIDVLHTHMFWASFYGAIAVAVTGTRVFVTTEHGRNPWKTFWHRWLERNLISRYSTCRICVSEDIREIRRSIDRIPNAQLIVIPNGTVIRDCHPHRMRDVPRLLAVGRLVEAKDYPTMINAVRMLHERGIKFTLDVAGDGPLMSELKRQSSSQGLDSCVRWLGRQTDIPTLMQESDIFVLSSIREGQPMVLLEAMVAALPIAATDVGAIPMTVRHEVEAVLVRPQDPEALAAAIERLIGDEPLAKKIGENARRRVTKEFAIDAIARTHFDLYVRFLSGSNL